MMHRNKSAVNVSGNAQRRSGIDRRRTGCFSALLLLASLASESQALPEDREQELLFDGDHSQVFLDEGRWVLEGSAGDPAWVSQGSLRIEGLRVEFQREGEELISVSATGQPARFQQQPRADQSVLHASATTITFDNRAGTVLLEGDAELQQEGVIRNFRAGRILYEIEARRLDAQGQEDERIRGIIPPQNRNDTP